VTSAVFVELVLLQNREEYSLLLIFLRKLTVGSYTLLLCFLMAITC